MKKYIQSIAVDFFMIGCLQKNLPLLFPSRFVRWENLIGESEIEKEILMKRFPGNSSRCIPE
jgi:hypothetical protein